MANNIVLLNFGSPPPAENELRKLPEVTFHVIILRQTGSFNQDLADKIKGNNFTGKNLDFKVLNNIGLPGKASWTLEGEGTIEGLPPGTFRCYYEPRSESGYIFFTVNNDED